MLHERIMIPSANGTEFPMDVYVPFVSKEVVPNPVRPAIVICPGGGYHFCSQREAEPIALRFLAHGFNTYVIWYREQKNEELFPKPQQDAAAAVAWVRSHAEAYHTDPDRIAILGFSAGGHLAGSLGVLWHKADLWQPLGLTPEQVKPNALCLCYPVISFHDLDVTHVGSVQNLLENTDSALRNILSPDLIADRHTPKAFIWHTFDDAGVDVRNALNYAARLRQVNVPVEMHLYPHGPHGMGLAEQDPHVKDWSARLLAWLKYNEITKEN